MTKEQMVNKIIELRDSLSDETNAFTKVNLTSIIISIAADEEKGLMDFLTPYTEGVINRYETLLEEPKTYQTKIHKLDSNLLL